MGKDNRTWLEKQEEHKRTFAACEEQLGEFHQQFEMLYERIDAAEANLRKDIEQAGNPVFRWFLNRQLKKIVTQRKQLEQMRKKLGTVDESVDWLREELEKPPTVPIRHTRIVRIPVEAALLFLLIAAVIWVSLQFLVKH